MLSWLAVVVSLAAPATFVVDAVRPTLHATVAAVVEAGEFNSGRENLAFTATWCGPCERVRPKLEQLRREGCPLRFVDTDKIPELARHFNVTSIPALIALEDGREIDRVVGDVPEDRLRRLMTAAAPGRTPAVKPPEIPGASRVEPLLRVTYPVPQAKAKAIVAFLKKYSEVEFEAAIDGDELRVTAAPEVQKSLGPFLRDFLPRKTGDASAD